MSMPDIRTVAARDLLVGDRICITKRVWGFVESVELTGNGSVEVAIDGKPYTYDTGRRCVVSRKE